MSNHVHVIREPVVGLKDCNEMKADIPTEDFTARRIDSGPMQDVCSATKVVIESPKYITKGSITFLDVPGLVATFDAIGNSHEELHQNPKLSNLEFVKDGKVLDFLYEDYENNFNINSIRYLHNYGCELTVHSVKRFDKFSRLVSVKSDVIFDLESVYAEDDHTLYTFTHLDGTQTYYKDMF